MKRLLRHACSLGLTAAFFAMVGALFLACSTGVGTLLHWVIPAVDLGTAIVTGAVTVLFSGYCFLRFVEFGVVRRNESVNEEEDEIEDFAVARDFRLAVIHEPRRHNRRRAKR